MATTHAGAAGSSLTPLQVAQSARHRFARPPETAQYLAISRSRLYALMRDDTRFQRCSTKLPGGRSRVFDLDLVDQYVRGMAA